MQNLVQAHPKTMNYNLFFNHQSNQSFQIIHQVLAKLDKLNRCTNNLFKINLKLELIRMRRKHHDAESCALFRVLSNKPLLDEGGFFDFDGQDSLVRFINDHYLGTSDDDTSEIASRKW